MFRWWKRSSDSDFYYSEEEQSENEKDFCWHGWDSLGYGRVAKTTDKHSHVCKLQAEHKEGSRKTDHECECGATKSV